MAQKAKLYLGTNRREEQDNDKIYNCLCKSAKDDIFVTMEPEQYTFNVNNEKLVDGPCFLPTIIDHTYTNTLTNTEAAHENLASLAEYMEALSDCNVEKLNAHIKKQPKH